MLLFSGSSNRPLAEKVAQVLEIPVSPIEDFTFPDGERRIQIQIPVLGEECVILQSTNPPVDSYYLELFLIIDGLKRSGAKSVTVIMPYMGYMRQDHIFREGEAVSLLVMIKILESLKIDKFIGFDFHTVKMPEFFHIPVSHLSALPLFAEEIKKRRWNTNEYVLVSPDMGGLRRINTISDLLDGMPWIATVKHRDRNDGTIAINEITGPDEGSGKVRLTESDLKGRKVLMIDDMISSGGTVIDAANLLRNAGVNEINLFITHPIFSKQAPKLLEQSIIDRVFVTDSVSLPNEKRCNKLHSISIADQIAKELKTR